MPSGVYIRSEFHKNKLRESIKKRMDNGFIPTIVGWHKGIPHSEEHKAKMIASMKGKKHSKFSNQTIEKMRKRMIGNKYTLGHKLSDEHREKIRKATKERVEKGIHNFWQGGITTKKYTDDWTATLRRSIRERDNYTCQICSKQQTDRAFSVHHIDYNKENCNPNNLITLCVKCHASTNVNRERWKEYFSKKYRVKQ